MYTADRGIFYIPAYNRDGHAMHSKALIFPEGLISVDLALVNCVWIQFGREKSVVLWTLVSQIKERWEIAVHASHQNDNHAD